MLSLGKNNCHFLHQLGKVGHSDWNLIRENAKKFLCGIIVADTLQVTFTTKIVLLITMLLLDGRTVEIIKTLVFSQCGYKRRDNRDVFPVK